MMIDFINYHRTEYSLEAQYYKPVKVKELYLDDHFDGGIQEYMKNIPFKFDIIKFKADLIGPVLGVNGKL